MAHVTRVTVVCLLLLTGLALAPLSQPAAVQAASESVTVCNETAFSAALTSVQSSGGGTIVIDCTDPIVFSSDQQITSDVMIIGDGAILEGAGSRLFRVDQGARLALIGLTLRHGSSDDSGGAVWNAGTLEVIATTFESNFVVDSHGGAIYDVGDSLEITASTFNNNYTQSSGSGGAIVSRGESVKITASTFSKNSTGGGGGGGAIALLDGSLEITASTFRENTAGSAGGALYLPDGTATITASTFHENSSSIAGGAIYSRLGDAVTISASTFSDNAATDAPHDSFYNPSGAVRFSSSILTNSAGVVCSNLGSPIWISDGYNLVDDNSCGLASEGDRTGGSVTINLETLQENGGPTDTMEPLEGSDAIGAIPAASCLTYSSSPDQRGVPRPQDNCEVGAVELGDVPVQIITTYQTGPIIEDETAIVGAVASGPAGATLTYAFDCDDDGHYEVGPQSETRTTCHFPAPGSRSVPVQVSDGTTTATAAALVEVRPKVDITSLDVSPSPSDETIDEVTLTAGFSYLNLGATLACTIDWGDGTLEAGGLVGAGGSGTCTGQHTYADDAAYSVAVEVCADSDCGDLTRLHTVDNLPPVIDSITTSQAGSAVTVTVNATDPGVLDILSYSFDCDGDGTAYEIGPQPENVAVCLLDPNQASVTINVLVEDGDGGEAPGSVTVNQTATVCASRYTGALSAPAGNGSCPSGSVTLSVPGPGSTTLCINPYTGAITRSASGTCDPRFRVHTTPDDGPLYYCESAFTGTLRYAAGGQCVVHERPGVIPG